MRICDHLLIEPTATSAYAGTVSDCGAGVGCANGGGGGSDCGDGGGSDCGDGEGSDYDGGEENGCETADVEICFPFDSTSHHHVLRCGQPLLT